MINTKSAWQKAELVKSSYMASNVKSLVFKLEHAFEFAAGQHVDVKLTAPDGYVAERSYSIASSPLDNKTIELGVELLPDGEVSPYLWKLVPGQIIEIRGPIGGHFVWEPEDSRPTLLVGGGSGVAPFLSMARLHDSSGPRSDPMTLFISARDEDKILMRSELLELAHGNRNFRLIETLTDSSPISWAGFTGRITEEMFAPLVLGKNDLRAFICGPNGFVSAASKILTDLGVPASSIKTERFGGK